MNDLQNEVSDVNENLADIYDPEVKKVVLEPAQEGSETRLAVTWNTQNGEVKLDPSTLPELPADQQYQLWVLTDGQPTSMGVLPKDARQVMLASEKTTKGDAFAITIEPLGGKESPTLEQLVVMGKTAA
jgi:anti-sigma-K factor RskA